MNKLASRAAILGAMVFCAAETANAAVIFDNIDLPGSVSVRGAGSSPGAQISVSSNVTINQIAVRNDLDSSGNLKFLIFDHANHTLLFNSGSEFFVDDGMSLKMSDLFSFTLLAGTFYDIGAIADVGGRWAFDQQSNSQNGLTSNVTNPNFANFAVPTADNHAGADAHIQLLSAANVPEPATLGLLGAGLAGIAAMRRRKRNTPPLSS